MSRRVIEANNRTITGRRVGDEVVNRVVCTGLSEQLACRWRKRLRFEAIRRCDVASLSPSVPGWAEKPRKLGLSFRQT